MTPPPGAKPHYRVKATTTPHKSELEDIDTGDIVLAPYVGIDRPMMESAAWHSLPAKEHEIYFALKAKWGSETSGGQFLDKWVPFGVADCTKYGISIEWDRLDKAMLRFQDRGFIEYQKTGQSSGEKNSFRLKDDWRKWKPGACENKRIWEKPLNSDGEKRRQPSSGKIPLSGPCKEACEGKCKSKDQETIDQSKEGDRIVGIRKLRNPIEIPPHRYNGSNGVCRNPPVPPSAEIRTAVAGYLDRAGEMPLRETVEEVAQWIESYPHGAATAMRIAEEILLKDGPIEFCPLFAERLGVRCT